MRHRVLATAFVLASLCGLLALTGQAHAAKPSRHAMSAEDRRAAIDRAGLASEFGVDPIAASEEMRELAERVAGTGTSRDRLIRLQAHLFDPKNYSFDYEARTTLTAIEAYERKRGNCVSFTNLFIALGRSVGIPVHASVPFTVPGEQALGDLIILDSHLVATFANAQRLMIFDFERNREQVPVGYQPIDDVGLIALYLNNLGVESLIAGDLDLGRRQFEAAVGLGPDFVEALSNLAVAYRRQGDNVAALDAYVLALRNTPRRAAILNNLKALYSVMDPTSDSSGGETLNDAARESLALGDEALAVGSPTRAYRIYRRAVRQSPSSAETHVAVARALIVKDRTRAAIQSLHRALELDPEHASAKRLLRGVEAG